MDDGKVTLLVKGTGISNPKFSGDGNTVAFMQGGALHAYDFATSQARILLEGVDSYCPGKKGEFYASLQKAGIVAVNPQTAESSTIVPAGEDISYINLKLSPDSKYLAYDSVKSGVEGLDKEGIWLYDMSSKEAKMIVKVTKEDYSVGPSAGKWSPDSGKILIWIMPRSASLSADCVKSAVYDVAGGKLTDLKTCALAYDENVSFADTGAFAMITGGGRSMLEAKA
ncbi:MAG: hypothetical protein NUV45_02215 [Tepidanaerobacteraceae bacterium]|jgi:Tol biopolymer transport system component|nr:hypothetical protein [Tepidanaerobacteraceae bacterium]